MRHTNANKKTRRVAVISGASSGIGLETAHLFLQNGWIVYGLCRNMPPLPDIIHIRTDLTVEADVTAAFQEITRRESRLDVLINNAGFGISGAAEFCTDSEIYAQFGLNFMGVMRCIRNAIPLMRENGGTITIVSSLAAIFPVAYQSFYSASKAAINALAMALRTELALFGIAVCAVMPGDVQTSFTASRMKSVAGNDVYHGKIERSVNTMEQDEKNGMQPLAIAKKIYKISLKPNPAPFYTVGFIYKLLAILEKLLPKRFISFIMGRLYG